MGAEVAILEARAGKEGDFFRALTKHGPYVNGLTRQGTYLFTAAGEFLVSGNTQDPTATLQMLKKGLRMYGDLPRAQRVPSKPVFTIKNDLSTFSPLYPTEGLVLDVSMRKLFTNPPRAGREQYRNVAWNQDHAWFRADEARQILPNPWTVGATTKVPVALVERLARLHLLDTTRAFASPYPKEAVKKAELSARVIKKRDQEMEVEYTGTVDLQQTGLPRFARSTDPTFPVPQKNARGYRARWLGRARFDTQRNVFTFFELVALGSKTGGATFAIEDPVTMGVAFTIAGNGIPDRVEPRYLDQYGWQKHP